MSSSIRKNAGTREWTLNEELHSDWTEELVTFRFSIPASEADLLGWGGAPVADQAPDGQAAVSDTAAVEIESSHRSTETVPAQVWGVKRQEGMVTGNVSFRTDLRSGERKRCTLLQSAESLRPVDSPLEYERTKERLVIRTGAFGCEVPIGEHREHDGMVPGPICRLLGSNGKWFGNGIIRCPRGSVLRSELSVEGPLLAIVLIRVHAPDSGSVEIKLRLMSKEPTVLVDEEFSDFKGEFSFSFGDRFYGEQCGHWRCANPSPELRPADYEELKKLAQTKYHYAAVSDYSIDGNSEQQIYIQAFDPWARDVSLWWGVTASSTEDFMGFFGRLPADWWNVPQTWVRVTTGPELRVHGNILSGRRKWGLILEPAFRALPADPFDFSFCDRALARYGRPNLDWLKEQVLLWDGWDKIERPRLLVRREDVDEVRSRLSSYAPFRDRLEAHKDDSVDGWEIEISRYSPDSRYHLLDLAGRYLATGKDRYARLCFESLRERIEVRLRFFQAFGYGYCNKGISISRPVRDMIMDWDLIAGSDAISPEERRYMTAAFSFLASVFGDPNHWPAARIGFEKGNINMHSDDYTALACLAAFADGHPQQEQWLDYVYGEMDAEFLRNIHPAGVWVEAPTYWCFSLRILFYTAVVLKNSGNRDYFTGQSGEMLKRTTDCLERLLTPTDPRCGSRMLPTIGDTTGYYHSQGSKVLFARMANQFRNIDPAFSRRMMRAWKNAGAPIISIQEPLWKFTMALTDPALPAAQNEPMESELLPGLGVLLRINGGTDRNESYLLFKMGPIQDHYDPDEGSILWYHRNTPLLVDYGSMYRPSNTQPWFHNRISVNHRMDKSRGSVTAFVTSPSTDFVRGEVIIDRLQEVPEYPGRTNFRMWPPPEEIAPVAWSRSLIFDKSVEALCIRDDLAGTLPTDWSLNVFADELSLDSSRDIARAVFTGQFGYDLAVFVAAPNPPSMSREEWSHRGYYEQPHGEMLMQHYAWVAPDGMPAMEERAKVLRLNADAGQPYLTLLVPYPAGTAVPDVVAISTTGGVDPVGFRLHRTGVEAWLIAASRATVVQDGRLTFRGRTGGARIDSASVTLTIIEGELMGADGFGLCGAGPVWTRFSGTEHRIVGGSDGAGRRITISGVDPDGSYRIVVNGKQQSCVHHLSDPRILEFNVPAGPCSFELSSPEKA